MIITRNWLNNYLNLNKVTNHDIGIALNSLGFEVEEEIDYEKLNTKMIIGYVVEHHKIEGTHLNVNQVKIGKNKISQIVCGADNVEVGQYVLVAPVGAKIANGLTMTVRKLQGYDSNGMICALNEIGFNKNQLTDQEMEDIYVIENFPVKKLETLIGHSINVLGFDDYSWDVDLTLNRSDALSAFQIVKELANYFNLDIRRNFNSQKNVGTILRNFEIPLKIHPSLSPLVNTVAISTFSLKNYDFKLKTTDDLWLKMSGSKTTNKPIYDLANKVAIESGQPIILLDYDKIQNLNLEFKKINDKEFVVLKNNNEVVNVIGKEVEQNYAVNENTQKVLVVYLNFNQTVMRKQQQNLNLSNVNLQRYMKPIYPNKANLANQSLSRILNGYGIVKTLSTVRYLLGPVKTKNSIKTSISYINDFLGIDLSYKDLTSLFKKLDFEIIKKTDDKIIFNVDPNRIDLESQIDLTEEVARIYGYDNIPTTPLKVVANQNDPDYKNRLINKMIDYLIGSGMNNIKTYSLISAKDNKTWNMFKYKSPIKLLSPLSTNHEQYRLSLASSMIETISNNLAKDNEQLRLFEVGDVYYDKDKRRTHLMIGMNGNFDYYSLKSYLDAIFKFLNFDPLEIKYNVQSDVIDEIHPYINAQIEAKKTKIGFIYKLNPEFENSLKIGPTFLAELDLDKVLSVADLRIISKPISKYQASSRDLSFELDADKTYQDIIAKLTQNVSNLVDYKLIDIYTNREALGKDKISLTISFTFNNLEEQMDENDINNSWEQVLSNAKELGLKVR